jgi:hypothetical protein
MPCGGALRPSIGLPTGPAGALLASCVIDLDRLTVLRGRATPQALQLVRHHLTQIRAAWDQINPLP